MGKKEGIWYFTKAFKDWVNDTPLRIWGWIMALIVFVGGLLYCAIWVQQHFPPWQVWVAFVLVIVGVICLSFIPYYKRVRSIRVSEQNKSKMQPPKNETELIDAIANAKIAIDNYVVSMNSVRKFSNSEDRKKLNKDQVIKYNESTRGKTDEIMREYEDALDLFDRQILISGINYEFLLNPLLSTMQFAPMQHLIKWKRGQKDMNYLDMVDKDVKETIKKIREIGQ